MQRLPMTMMIALVSVTACATDGGPGSDPVCGDGTCSGDESHATCAADCPDTGPFCGDGTCNNNETTATCAADCPAAGPFCGDGTCNGSETTTTCPADCAQTACTSAPDSCTGETVCVAGSCVAAFGRVYKVVMVDGVMTQTDSTGATWDPLGGLPDPMIKLTLNGTDVGVSSSKQDTLTPAWNEFLSTAIPGGSSFVISVFDADVSSNDQMFSCQNAPLTANLLRVHGAPYVTCSGTGALASAHVRLAFLPQ